jgi:hypothetical protein
MSELSQNSTIVTYRASSTGTLTSVNGELRMSNPISFGQGTIKKVRLISATLSSRIPNVYRHAPSAFNNGIFAVSRTGGAPWTNIQLTDGTYTVAAIQAALMDVTQLWWTDPTIPGISFSANTFTDRIWVTLDSTLLAAPGQVAIDFAPALSGSRFSELMGFTAPTQRLVDGVFSGNVVPLLDWAGNNCVISVIGLGGLSFVNSQLTTEIAQIPLTAATVTNQYVFPSAGQVAPFVNCSISDRLNSLAFTFTGDRNDVNGTIVTPRPIFLTDGGVSISLQIIWGRA